MGRKVFISFLGTTNYVETIYMLDDKKLHPTRFIQEALIEHFCQEWTNESRIYIFCTREAEIKNWNDEGHDKVNEDIEKIGLNHRLMNMKQMGLMPEYEMVPIDEGFSKDEIWRIFNTVYSKILPEDNVYLDITHAFRSIPMLATALFDYAKYLKKANFVSVSYGAFEKLGQAYEVRTMPLEDRIAPIVDMSEVIELQKCVQMANGVTRYGRFNVLAEILEKTEEIPDIGAQIRSLDEALNTNIGPIIKEGRFKTTLEQKKKINKLQTVEPVKEVLKHILEKEIAGFKVKGNLENYLETARWAFKHGMLTQAYTFGKEYINRMAEKKVSKLNPFPSRTPDEAKRKDSNYLQFVNKILGLKPEDIETNNFREDLALYIETTKYLLSLNWIQELRKNYVQFNDYRNQIDHCKLDKEATYESLYTFFEQNFESLVTIVKEATKEERIMEDNDKLRVFINLTNHPSCEWDKSQIDAANQYGSIIDMSFPKVLPTTDPEDIRRLTVEYVEKISVISSPKLCVIHIMGEMTLTFSLVTNLKALGFTCVASTTNRIVNMLPDGSKNVKFEFCRFREY